MFSSTQLFQFERTARYCHNSLTSVISEASWQPEVTRRRLFYTELRDSRCSLVSEDLIVPQDCTTYLPHQEEEKTQNPKIQLKSRPWKINTKNKKVAYLVFFSISCHGEWTVHELILPGMLGFDNEGVRSTPKLAFNDGF